MFLLFDTNQISPLQLQRLFQEIRYDLAVACCLPVQSYWNSPLF